MVAVPAETAVAIPDIAPMVIIAGEVEFQVPPGTALVKLEVDPVQMADAPVMADGDTCTLTILTDEQVPVV